MSAAIVPAVLLTFVTAAIAVMIVLQAIARKRYITLLPLLMGASSPKSAVSALYFYQELNPQEFFGLWAAYLLIILVPLTIVAIRGILKLIEGDPPDFHDKPEDFSR